MASAMMKPCSLLRQHIPATVITAYASPKFISNTGSHASASELDIKPLNTTEISSFKRGTGGRSSFNGIVATVFGGTGFLGGSVVSKLGKQGTQVIIPNRGDNYELKRLKLAGDLGQILYLPMHLQDEKCLYKAMKYSNVVINMIGRGNHTKNFSLEDTNVTGARNIARIARECGVKRLIHVSALNAAEKPKGLILKGGSEFLASKWRGENAVREEFPDAIIFRPSDMYGQADNFLSYYASIWRRQLSKVPLWNKGKGVIKQPVFMSDVSNGIVKSVFEPDAPGKVFQAAGPKRYELSELIDWFYRVMRKTEEDWGYRRIEMKYNLIFWMQVKAIETVMRTSPKISWERIEREHVTDVVIPEMPTLEDLGIPLTALEDRIKWELKPLRAFGSYVEEYGEFEEPAPAPVYAGGL